MEIEKIFMNIIWLCGFLILCTGALWMLKVIWDSLTLMRARNGEKDTVESIIEELNEIEILPNALSDRSIEETED